MGTFAKVPAHIVAALSDPFDVFPLMHELRGLGRFIEEDKDYLFSQYEDVAPKYRDVGLEQGLEAISIGIGAGFVAAQSILTRTFSGVKKLSEIEIVQSATNTGLPKAKSELFRIAAHDRHGVPDIEGINALANYFKHGSEWPYDWRSLKRQQEIETATTVSKMGLCSGNPDNMLIGASTLAFGGSRGLEKLADRVQEWREAVASEIGRRLAQAGLFSI
jgi:hypothetical protein